MNIIKKLFSPVCLTISIFLLVYIFYRSEIHWNGTIRDYYFIYYLISSVLILCSIITFYISEKIKIYLIITLISVVFSLYAFEGYLTTGMKLYKKTKLYKQQTGKNYDTREKLEIYNDLKKKDENVVVSVYMGAYLTQQNKLFPFSGISNSKTIHCNENGYYSIYQSDRYGFNNPDSEWDKKEIEYLLVGDSFTHGACVNRPDDIASVLRTLSKKSVLNLGYSGKGPLIEYATLREYLKPNVKKVLWIYFEVNDLSDLDNELNLEIIKLYLKDLNFTQNLKSKQDQIDKLAIQQIERVKGRIKGREWRNSLSFKLLKFIKIKNLRNSLRRKPQPQPQPQFKEILKLAKELSIKNNSNFYFVYLPNYFGYRNCISYAVAGHEIHDCNKVENIIDVNKATQYNNSYNEVKKIVEELNISFIDIPKEVFDKETNPLKLFPFELNGHYNVEGYRKVAEAIHKFISK